MFSVISQLGKLSTLRNSSKNGARDWRVIKASYINGKVK